jgi:signal transduction histidine kinase/BarA-like signal transduction histidine kinase
MLAGLGRCIVDEQKLFAMTVRTGLRVLLVEDSPDDAEIVLAALRREGCEPNWTRVDNAAHMRAALREHSWDLVLCDYAMPRFDALSALAVLKTEELDVPFIIVSGTMGEETAVAAMKAGAQDFFSKDKLMRLPAAIERELREATVRAEQRRLQNRMLLSDRLVAVGTLAAGVAHEINNPLAYVIANVQYALDGIGQLPAVPQPAADAVDAHDARERALIKEALYEANEGARRVQRIVADLKTLARQGDDRVEPIDVEHTLNWAIGVTMAEIRHRARLVKSFERVSPVRGDEMRLGQVFVNLLLNAAQAIGPGNALENEIVVNTRERDGRVVVEVLDSGMGIPEENLTKIFDPFFTTKPRGIGTGLGLSICHEIIASMRGQLTAENRPTRGAQFVVEMPALSAYQSQVALSQRHAKSSRPPVRSAHILIIDDESLAAKALGRMLRDHRVEIADHAPTGMKMAIENHYDVIFCDLMMPELSGMAVYASVLRENAKAAARMVFITGGTFTEEARAFAAHHAAHCLFKPFDSSLVKGAVERLLLADTM